MSVMWWNYTHYTWCHSACTCHLYWIVSHVIIQCMHLSHVSTVGDFHCPITQELMKDPVVAAGMCVLTYIYTPHKLLVYCWYRVFFPAVMVFPGKAWGTCPWHVSQGTTTHYVTMHVSFLVDGFTYERSAITSWFSKGRRTSPSTNLPLANTLLVPNKHLRTLIEKTKTHNWLKHFCDGSNIFIFIVCVTRVYYFYKCIISIYYNKGEVRMYASCVVMAFPCRGGTAPRAAEPRTQSRGSEGHACTQDIQMTAALLSVAP